MGVSCPERMSQFTFIFLWSNIFIRTRIDRCSLESHSHQKRQWLFSLFKNRKRFSRTAPMAVSELFLIIYYVIEKSVLRHSCGYHTRQERGKPNVLYNINRAACCLIDRRVLAISYTLRWWPLFSLRLYRQTFVSESSESTEKKNTESRVNEQSKRAPLL